MASTLTLHAVRADDFVLVKIDYETRPGCPDADTFVREVLSRAPRARVGSASDGARSLVARVRAGARGLEGVLSVRDADGHTTERAVHGQRCEELVTALAVIAALVIDPLTARAEPFEPDAATGTTDAATTDSPDAAPAALPQLDAAAPEAALSAPTADGPTGHPGPGTNDGWKTSAGAAVGVVGGTAPSVLLSMPVFVEVSRRAEAIVEPTARLRFERTAVGVTRKGGSGGASFVRTVGAADLCAIALRGRSIRAQPCARAELGGVYAKGLEIVPARGEMRPWLALGPVARARVDVIGPLFVELEAALLFAVVRDSFYVEPGTLLYRPPALGATTAFGAGLAF
ncbi:MAG: hypothetical protein JWP87_4545 [Labilithrix sp.]|nr:hypothetical protein [Labilithrix sp.]